MTEADAIRAATSYNPLTGEFLWVKSVGRGRPGYAVGGRWEDPDGRKRTQFMGKRCQIAVLIWLYMTGEWPKGQVDHLNQNPADCRWSNLRDVPRKQNQQNERRPRKQNTTGYLGVQKTRNGKFVGVVWSNGRQYKTPRFPSAAEAHEAYVLIKRRLHEGCTL
jgi:hypothetical protein